MRYFILIMALSVVLFSCKKKSAYGSEPQPYNDIRGQGVGLYLPAYFGSYWVYKNYKDSGGRKQFQGIQTTRYDSVANFFFTFDNDNKFLSYGYWYRDGLDIFKSGQGQLLLTDTYLDSAVHVPFLLAKGSNFSNYIYGGLDTLMTGFGPVPCIKTSGENKSGYRWFRYFGKNIGVVKEEEYTLYKTDTIDHMVFELDHYKVNR